MDLRRTVRRALARRSFCTLATVSPAGFPHVVGIMYQHVDGALYMSTSDGSRKVRNIRANPRVAVCVPVRRWPAGPPFSVQFQATAEVLDRTDPAIVPLLEARRLRRITAFGVMDDPRTLFVKVTPNDTAFTYGLGVSLWSLMRDPVNADREVRLR